MIIKANAINRIVGIENRNRKNKVYFIPETIEIEVPEVKLEKNDVIANGGTPFYTDGIKTYTQIIPYGNYLNEEQKQQTLKNVIACQMPNYRFVYYPDDFEIKTIKFEENMFKNIVDDTCLKTHKVLPNWKHNMIFHDGEFFVENPGCYVEDTRMGQPYYCSLPKNYANLFLFSPKDFSDDIFKANLKIWALKMINLHTHKENNSDFVYPYSYKKGDFLKLNEKLLQFFKDNSLIDYFGGVDIPLLMSADFSADLLLKFFDEYVNFAEEKNSEFLSTYRLFCLYKTENLLKMIDYYKNNYGNKSGLNIKT